MGGWEDRLEMTLRNNRRSSALQPCGAENVSLSSLHSEGCREVVAQAQEEDSF